MAKNNTTDRTVTDSIVGRQPSPLALWGMTIGLLMIVAGTLMPILGNVTVYKWIYSAGALLLLVSRMFAPYTGNVIRIKRLYRIESWSAIFFCVAAFFMFYQPAIMRDWLAFTMAGGAIQIYTSLMIPAMVKKEGRRVKAD